jgi:hypothetical protein
MLEAASVFLLYGKEFPIKQKRSSKKHHKKMN